MQNILVIPDTQIRPDNLVQNAPLLSAVGQLIVSWKPDVVVHIGDHFDMHSLSTYDFKPRNRITFDGDEVCEDVAAAEEGMDMLLGPLFAEQARQRQNKQKVYNPRRIFTLGNHEQRADRFSELRGLVDIRGSLNQLGWEVYDYLEPVMVEQIMFVHYAANPLTGRPYGGSAEYRLNKMKTSFVQGHEQTFKYAEEYLNDGRSISALVGGACYLHDEPYKGYQGNNHFRGCFMLHDADSGRYDLEQVSTRRLLG